MTIQEFTKQNNLPELKKIGIIKGTTYYIKKDIPNDIEEGVPLMVKSVGFGFEICTSDEALEIMGIFYE